MNRDAKTAIGQTIRFLRESSGISQEKLSERAKITYQYLSALENGKENFTIGVLESIAHALEIEIATLVEAAYADSTPVPRINPEFFIKDAPLPPHLSIKQVQAALNETHTIIRAINSTLMRTAGRPLSAYIQANNFSGIVSNVLCDAFSRLSPYRHNHDQRYPDLVCLPKNNHHQSIGLEVKTTVRPGKGGESHNGHSGWHLIACFQLDKDSGDIRFIHVMFADLIGHGKADADWKYVGSKVNEATGSQRTETYVTNGKGTAKLRHGSIYLDLERVKHARWRTSLEIDPPAYSLFGKKKNRP